MSETKKTEDTAVKPAPTPLKKQTRDTGEPQHYPGADPTNTSQPDDPTRQGVPSKPPVG